MIEIDLKSRVEATLLKEEDIPGEQEPIPGGCFHHTPGRLLFGCPGCGRFGSIVVSSPKNPISPSWDLVSGNLDDPKSLTIAPSINCVGCCGWHGYLRNGVFEPC